MTGSEQSQLSKLLAPLDTLHELGVGRPTQMTLSLYLSHLTQFALLSKTTSDSFLTLYHQLRFARSEVSLQELEETIGAFQPTLRKVEEASISQQEEWLQVLSYKIELDTDESNVSQDESLEPSQPSSVSEEKVASSDHNHKVVTTLEEKSANTKAPRPFLKTTMEEPAELSGVKRFFTRSLLSHLWWILFLGILGGVVALYQGAKRYDRVMALRYRIQNKISKSFGFQKVTIPPKYRTDRDQTDSIDRSAVRFTQYILRRYPNNAHLWHRLASYHYNRDNYAEAIAFYYRSLSLEPNHALALNGLAWLLCTSSEREFRDPVRALSFAERAYQLKKTPEITDTYAEASFLNGKLQRAVTLMQEAISLKPKKNKKYYTDQLKRFRKALRLRRKSNVQKGPTSRRSRRFKAKKGPTSRRSR